MTDDRYLVVFDLEYTSWRGYLESGWKMPGKHREIVQFGAVKLALERDYVEVGFLDHLVKPRIHPELSQYFIDLTGIEQDVLNQTGRPFEEVFFDFMSFIEGEKVDLACWGDDMEVIRENCDLLGMACPSAINKSINLIPMISQIAEIGGRRIHSSGLPHYLGVAWNENAHDALSDSRALAASLQFLASEGRFRLD